MELTEKQRQIVGFAIIEKLARTKGYSGTGFEPDARILERWAMELIGADAELAAGD